MHWLFMDCFQYLSHFMDNGWVKGMLKKLPENFLISENPVVFTYFRTSPTLFIICGPILNYSIFK